MPSRPLSWNPFLRFPRLSLACLLLAGAPLLLRLRDFRVSSETRVLLEGDQRNLASYERVQEIIGENHVVLVDLELPEVFSPAGIDAIRRVSAAFETQRGVTDVTSLTHSFRPVRQGLAFAMVPMIETGTLAELGQMREFSLHHPLVRNLMVAHDSRHTMITITYRRDFSTPAEQDALRGEVDAVLAPFREEGIKCTPLALPLVEAEIRSDLRRDVFRFLPAAIGLLALILWLNFRSLAALAVVLLNPLFGLLLIPGAIQLGGFSLNIFTIMLVPLLAGVHLSLLVHLLTAFDRARREAASHDEVMALTLRLVWKSCVFSALTTIIGLLSLTATDVRPVREFGLLGAAGIAGVFAMTFGPGLAMLKIILGFSNRPNRPHPAPAAPAMVASSSSSAASSSSSSSAALTRWIARHRMAILGGALAALGLTVAGFGRLRTDIRAVEFLSPSSPTRQAVEEFDRVYGGANFVQIEIDSGVAEGVNTPEFLRYVHRIQTFAEIQNNVSAVYSYPQLLGMMNQIWEGKDATIPRLPENPLLIGFFAASVRSQGLPFLDALTDPTSRVTQLVVRTRDMPAQPYLELIRQIVDFAESIRPPQVTVSAAAGMHSIVEADRRILRGQLSTVGLTVAAIGLVLALLWRSVTLALASLVTNAIAVAFVIGGAAYAGVPLNSVTAMVGAVALGMAVDDSIHFITFWRDARARGEDRQRAIAHTLEVKGRAIVCTSLILIGIFVVFLFSSFPPVVAFGVLSAIAFTAALVSVLLLLPALLLIRRRRSE